MTTGVTDFGTAERTLWDGTPRLRYCTWELLACLLLFFLVIPPLYGLWIAVRLKHIRYTITTERIRIRTGIFSQRWQDLELHRVKDSTLTRSFWRERLFGLATLEVVSGDASSPELLIFGIDNDVAMRLWEDIRRNSDRLRRARRTIAVEEL